MEKNAAQSTFSQLVQIGLVVRDAEKTARRLEQLGMGPFELRTLPSWDEWFRGKPMKAKFKIYVANVGGMDIELIQPVEGDSPHQEFLDTKGEGIQHIAFAVDDVEKEITRLTQNGASVLLRAKQKSGSRSVAYMDLDAGNLITELIQK